MDRLNVAHINIRSLLPKYNEIYDYLLNSSVDILAISETWLTSNISDDSLRIDGYWLLRYDREGHRGGGVCFYIRSTLNAKVEITSDLIEQLWVSLKFSTVTLSVGVVYKPPNGDFKNFIDNLEESLCLFNTMSNYVICLGDININLFNTDSRAALYFNDMIDGLDFKQLINEPTRITKSSSTLIDVLLSSDVSIVSDIEVVNFPVSDHELISCRVNISKSFSDPVFKYVRDFSQFDAISFEYDLKRIPFQTLFYIDSVDDKVDFLNHNIIQLFDNHAPYKNIKITKSRPPWITDNIKLMMSLRDKAKRRFKVTRRDTHWEYYKSLRNFTTLSIRNEKKAYFKHISKSKNENMWRELRKLNIVTDKKNTLPVNLQYPDDINNFFIDSVPRASNCDEMIRLYNTSSLHENCVSFKFLTVTEDVVNKFLFGLKSKSFGSDNISLQMIKLCCPVIIPYLTHIINTALLQNCFPSAWKSALIIPLPKKDKPTTFFELRPISILPTLSKVMEKIINVQVKQFLENYNILPDVQSGFRVGHSCETALLNITDDIVSATDRGQITVLTLLDYSKAFDTISHNILLAKLHYIGFGSDAVDLVRSYLSNRTQMVKVPAGVSGLRSITQGVPQGSILGPVLFSIYISDFPKVLEHCSIHMYADDTQIYHSFYPSECADAIKRINGDLNRLHRVSVQHSLNINPLKSITMIFGNKNERLKLVDVLKCRIDNSEICLSDTAKNLGVTMDTCLRFRQHIANCTKKACLGLKLLYPHRACLDQSVKALLCEGLVLSQFSYCSAMYGPFLDEATSRRIQRVQNSCIRLIFGIRKYDHISDKFSVLKWLNMANRRKLYSASLFHKIICRKKPTYLYNRINFRKDVHERKLRNLEHIITPPLHRTALFERGFSYAISKLYNDIPTHFKLDGIETFKLHMRQFLLEMQLGL